MKGVTAIKANRAGLPSSRYPLMSVPTRPISCQRWFEAVSTKGAYDNPKKPERK
jgi:hypothetical protein